MIRPLSTVSKSATTEPAVVIKGVTKVFPVSFRRKPLVALRELNLEVAQGKIFGLLGPNGSGKSTTLKIILGLVTPTHGSVKIFGIQNHRTECREVVGFLPENPYFYKYLTGRETLRFYGKLCGLHGARLRDRVSELLEIVRLRNAADQRLSSYSKGMLQRIGLAQALLPEPRLLILDEPDAGVDPGGAREIRDLIVALKKRGITVLLSSHLLGQMQEVCDYIGILARGVLVREGALSELLGAQHRIDFAFENPSPRLLNEIEMLAARNQTKLVQRRFQTSLEDYFLEVTQSFLE